MTGNESVSRKVAKIHHGIEIELETLYPLRLISENRSAVSRRRMRRVPYDLSSTPSTFGIS